MVVLWEKVEKKGEERREEDVMTEGWRKHSKIMMVRNITSGPHIRFVRFKMRKDWSFYKRITNI